MTRQKLSGWSMLRPQLPYPVSPLFGAHTTTADEPNTRRIISNKTTVALDVATVGEREHATVYKIAQELPDKLVFKATLL